MILVATLLGIALSSKVRYTYDTSQLDTLIETDFKPVTNVEPYETASGTIKEKLQQYFNNIPIFGATIVVEYPKPVENERIIYKKEPIFGTFYEKSFLSLFIKNVVPKFTPKEIINNVLKIKESTLSNQDSQLWIYYHNNRPYLAYIMTLYGENGGQSILETDDSEIPQYARWIVVNALTGEIIENIDMIHKQLPKTVFDIGGNRNVASGNNGEGVKHEFTLNTVNGNVFYEIPDVKVCDMKGRTIGLCTTVECNNDVNQRCYDDSINGAYGVACDAFEFGRVTFELFDKWAGGRPLAGGVQLELRVHYGNNYENAFWDGQRMTFGDGANTFYPLVSLDVVAHEVGHGYTTQYSGLIYRDQSGGVNEAYSDLAGIAADYMHYGSTNFNWYVGDKICKSCTALRYMNDPPRDGRSIGHANDYYNGINVHYSSGVFNKAFYLMVTYSDSEQFTPLDVFKIASKANEIYWQPSSNYDECACGMIYAAFDHGYDKYVDNIYAAFADVGVKCDGFILKDGKLVKSTGFGSNLPSDNTGNTSTNVKEPNYKYIFIGILSALIIFAIVMIGICIKHKKSVLNNAVTDKNSLISKTDEKIYDTTFISQEL